MPNHIVSIPIQDADKYHRAYLRTKGYKNFTFSFALALALTACGGSNNSTSSSSASNVSVSSIAVSSLIDNSSSSSSSVSISSKAIASSMDNSFSTSSSITTSSSMNSLSAISLSSSSVALPTYKLTKVSGDDQTGVINTALTTPIVLLIENNDGTPRANAHVTFSIASGSGSIASLQATTDAAGKVTNKITLGDAAGALHISAKVDGSNSSIDFRMTIVGRDDDANKASTVFNSDWQKSSHEKTTANYIELFPQDKVNTLDIVLTAAQWSAIKEDLKATLGSEFGSNAGGMGQGGGVPPAGIDPNKIPPGGGIPPAGIDPNNIPPGGGIPPEGIDPNNIPAGGGGFGGGFSLDDPAYTPVTVIYNGKQWKKVGYRLKGNSSLMSTWKAGNYKLPFRLKMNEFETVYSAIKGQRFYGFKDLSFSPGFNDSSAIHEKAAADIFRMVGIAAPRTAFYKVYIDLGDGRKYLGVYCMLETPDDTMVKDQFSEDGGNIYKPESHFNKFIESEFPKKNNKTAADFSDVQKFITALNDSSRTSNPAQWRANLEATFNVDHFLKWLAVNNAIVNWDTYGSMAHNHYLYNHSKNLLTWIPWDNNEALTNNPPAVGATTSTGFGMGRGLSLTMNEVGASWPLIRYLADDVIYYARYKEYLKNFNQNVFTQDAMDTLFSNYINLIKPYVVGPNGETVDATYTSEEKFNAALQTLKDHVANRKAVINTFNP